MDEETRLFESIARIKEQDRIIEEKRKQEYKRINEKCKRHKNIDRYTTIDSSCIGKQFIDDNGLKWVICGYLPHSFNGFPGGYKIEPIIEDLHISTRSLIARSKHQILANIIDEFGCLACVLHNHSVQDMKKADEVYLNNYEGYHQKYNDDLTAHVYLKEWVN